MKSYTPQTRQKPPQTHLDNLLKKKRNIYYGFSDDPNLVNLASECLSKDEILVFITPAVTKYKEELKKALNILKDNLWIYEMNMAMKVVMKKRTKVYESNYPNSVIC